MKYELWKDSVLVLKTNSYAKLYRELMQRSRGGTQYGIDIPTLHASGYEIKGTYKTLGE